ncbi:hypothetical protein R1sor_011568 [Riccia sorocarpa]|uniref:Uncharacterized protein n=1 Tax=Riccia sorocarpa TaxID=122646 RepID=A0ABD3I3Z6_9MARC
MASRATGLPFFIVVEATHVGTVAPNTSARVPANNPMPTTNASSGAAQGTKRKASVQVKKHKGFHPEDTIVGFEKEANVKILMDPSNTDEMSKVQEELSHWYPLGYDTLVWCHIAQLTNPQAAMVYRPCSSTQVARIQESMLSNKDSPQPATIIPYKIVNNKQEFMAFTTEAELLKFVLDKGRFMIISGQHSTRAAKNIIIAFMQDPAGGM